MPRCAIAVVGHAWPATIPLCALCQKRMRDISRCAPEVPAEFWETDQMRDALESRHMGRVFFAYRHNRLHDLGPLSQELLVDGSASAKHK
jgi:hypothetical protein